MLLEDAKARRGLELIACRVWSSNLAEVRNPRTTKIFVDNTKTFVLSSAHDQGTFAKANGV